MNMYVKLNSSSSVSTLYHVYYVIQNEILTLANLSIPHLRYCRIRACTVCLDGNNFNQMKQLQILPRELFKRFMRCPTIKEYVSAKVRNRREVRIHGTSVEFL